MWRWHRIKALNRSRNLAVLPKTLRRWPTGDRVRRGRGGDGIDGGVLDSPYEILESRGLTVYLVNARHVRHVSGRKSDVLDCQWLQQLMSFGLLSGAFRPAGEVCALRAISRQRDTLLREQARQIQRMQKAVTQMNVQLTNVITDIVGKTGQAIIRAVVAGE